MQLHFSTCLACWNVLFVFFFLIFIFKYKFIYFNWRLITLQYCSGFAIHWHESVTGVHVFLILHPPPTSLPIPLGHPSAPAPSTLSHASNLDWRFISHMTIYMFQSHSPESSHPCPLPQSPKDYSIHLCLFCCLTYRIIVKYHARLFLHASMWLLLIKGFLYYFHLWKFPKH